MLVYKIFNYLKIKIILKSLIKIYFLIKNISIDFAVMEYTKNAIMFPLTTKWSDLGTWSSLMNTSNKDNNENVLRGNIITSNTFSTLILIIQIK